MKKKIGLLFSASFVCFLLFFSFFFVVFNSSLLVDSKYVDDHVSVIGYFLFDNVFSINLKENLTHTENIHMFDVIVLISRVKIFFFCIILEISLILMYLLSIEKGKLFFDKKLFRNLSYFFASFFVLVGIFFSKFFILMHKILFNNNYWMLTENSYLLKMYPSSFFFYNYLILVLVYCLMSFGFYGFFSRFLKK